MNKKTIATGAGFAAIFVVLGAVALAPKLTPSVGNGPPVVGQMRYFVAAKTQIPRPEIAWKDAEGNTVRLARFDGKVVLLNYWATWCGPCLEELPSLNSLQVKLGGTDFEVVAVNLDLSGKPVAAPMAKRLKLDALALYLDTDSVSYRTMGATAMPTTYLFDRNGDVLGVYRGGAEWDSREAVALMKYYIERPAPAGALQKTSGCPGASVGAASFPRR